jgi:ubiquinone/menaquinone biosynthesis C-methylase UbiE
MMQDQPDPQDDEWSRWLLHRRHADDPVYERLVRATIERFRDRVLDGAELRQNMTLADIGTGDGLIAFGAIDRIGPSLRVILTDLSAPLLRHAETLATERGVHQQCTFLECSAEKLPDIPDASVDVVTTRAVLAYVTDKRAALREFHRILKPGGRLSIAEPIFMDDAYETIALRNMVDARPANSPDRFLVLLHRWKAAQFPDTQELLKQSPIANYSERDLLRFVGTSGFAEIRMELHIDILRSIITTWDVFLGSSPHPWAPTVGAILAKQFTPEERQLFEQTMRPVVENPKSTMTDRVAYLTARKMG